ncbi:MAG: DUF2631 domain-containing protein [Jatrophihabitantaceae bacterium]
MALNSHSEKPDLSLPEDYKADHPDEHPTDWGWHGEWGRASRVGGWVCLLILVVMITATHYNHSGTFWLILFAAALFVILVWDIQRRKNAWRK